MDKVDKLADIKQKCQNGESDEKVEMQHNLHKMTAKERILYLLDEGSFIEIGTLVQSNGGGVITGYGTIEGRLVFVYSQDYTVDGGAITRSNSKKICNIMDMAVKMGAPLIQIFDSVGAKLTEGIDVLASYGSIINKNAKLSGVIPQISIIAGPCSGVAALNATMSDFTIIVKEVGELGINPVHKLIKKEEKHVDESMYSNAEGASKNGSAQIETKDDKEAIEVAKRLLNYLPSNNLEIAPLSNEASDLNILNESLNTMVKENTCNVEEIIRTIADSNTIVEINKELERNTITSLVKINGLTVGVIGSLSNDESKLNIKACDKISRLVKICDSFNIPILSIVDNKGFVVSLKEEQEGLSLYAAKMVYSLAGANVPKVALIVGDAFGAGYISLASKEVSFDTVLAWPSARISLTEPKDLVKVLYRDEIINQENPKQEENNIIDKHLEEVVDPYKAAEKGYIDDIIMPSETKPRVFAMLDMLQSKRELAYPKKHGSTLV